MPRMMGRFFPLLVTLSLACTSDRKPLVGPVTASVSAASQQLVTGAVLGPDGSNICASLAPDAFVLVRPIEPAGPVHPNIFLFCPDNQFSVSLSAGNYLLRAALPADPGIGDFPTRTIVPLTVQSADVQQNIVVHSGLALGGSAVLDGAPQPDVDMSLTYSDAPGFAAAFGASGADGTWTEFFRQPEILQPGVRYHTSGACAGLGARVLEVPPLNFTFPSERSSVSCRLETSDAVRFSHTHTRLVVTPMPGEIGGQSTSQTAKYGTGWGVQFPVEAGQQPVHELSATHLFGGGLVLGIAPDRILSGIDLTGQVVCTSCQDLGLDGTLHFTPDNGSGRIVTWRYSDAGSPEGVGLKVLQRSYDGQLPNDYVLFKFSIQNKGANTVTFYAGDFMDWDVDVDAFDDEGFTEMGGRLMGVTSAFEGTGIHVGTLLLGAPISGVSFYDLIRTPVPTGAEQFQALSGGRQQFSVDPGDAHYFQGAGPITLKPGQKATLWIGIIAGESHDAFVANAVAAQADVARRQAADDDAASDGPLTVAGKSGLPQPRATKQKPQ